MRVRGADVLEGASCVVPVPLHASRRRQRGFNQAKDLARLLQLPVVQPCGTSARPRLRPNCPRRSVIGNVREAFAVTRAAASLVGAIVVLVDDVSTTGATLEACARVLKEAGVRKCAR